MPTARTLRFVALLAATASLGGCVTQGKYDALQRTLDETQATLTQRSGDNERLQGELKTEQGRANELAAQVRTCRTQLETTRRAKELLAGTNAAMIADKARLQASVEEMRAALAELSRRKAAAEARIGEFRTLLERFAKLIDAGKLRVKMVDGRMVVELASDVLFASGKANLSEDGQAAIDEVAGVLATIPERRFQIEGHTDNVPIRSAAYPSNWELASARSLTVLKRMVEGGMPPERISAASFGEFKPAKPNDTPEGKAANRRIEIVVLPDLSSLPGFDELNQVAGDQQPR